MFNPTIRSKHLLSAAVVVALALILGSFDASAQTAALPDPGAGPVADRAYDTTLMSLRTRLANARFRYHEMKRRLRGYKAQVHGAAPGSHLRLVHRNNFGDLFRIEKVRYLIDGHEVSTGRDIAAAKAGKSFDVYSGKIAPKSHTMTVEYVLRGNNGVFSYVDGYKFTIKAKLKFYVPRDRTTVITVAGVDKGGMGTAMQDRPKITFDVDHQHNAIVLPRKKAKK